MEEGEKIQMMENIPFQHFTHTMYYKLARWLDPENTVEGNDWRMLAEKLGYSMQDILVFDSRQSQHGSNTFKVLQDYSQKQGSTVNEVFRALQEINRPDALDELKKFIPDIERNYVQSLKKKHRHQELIENEYICNSCDTMPYNRDGSYPSYSQSHEKTMMSQGNGYGMCSGSEHLAVTDPSKSYQRHKSMDHPCMNSRLPSYDHSSPEFKRQRSMPLSDSMVVRGRDSLSQYYHDYEPMDQSPAVREDPVPPAMAMMRGMPRFNNQHGVPAMNSAIHTSEAETLFRQPFSDRQFSRQIERAGLKLDMPSPDTYHRQRSADFCSPSPTPTTPSTPLGHLQKLANERPFQPGDEYKELMKMKRDEELLQGKAEQTDAQEKMMDLLSPKGLMCHQGNHGDGQGQGHFRTSPRHNGPPNTYPLRSKSSCSTSPSTSTAPQLTKSASLPSNMKPAEFRKAFRHIKVLVTYSADDKKHTQRVLSLCNNLEKNGFSCCVDIYPRKLPVEERHNWYQKRFAEADFVLVVMSPKYRTEVDSCEMDDDADESDNADSDGGRSVPNDRLHTKNIYKLMYREYVHSESRCMRFVPLIFPAMCEDIIPKWLLDCNNGLYYLWPKQYKDLLWMLTKPENRVPDCVTPPISRCLQEGENRLTAESSEATIESE